MRQVDDMSEWRDKRVGLLRRLFSVFDLADQGFLTRDILNELGQARRNLGHKASEWNEDKAKAMLKRFDKDGDGRVSDVEFVLAFSESLPYDETDFMSVYKEYLRVAEHCRSRAGILMPSNRASKTPPPPKEPVMDDLRDGRWCQDDNIKEYLFGGRLKSSAPPRKEAPEITQDTKILKLNDALTAKNEALEDRLKRLEAELREERAGRQDWKRKYMDLHPKFVSLEAQHKYCNTDELMQQLNDCKADLKRCEGTRQRLSDENEELRAALEAHKLCENEKSALRMRNIEMKKQLDVYLKMAEEHSRCQKQKADLQDQVKELRQQLKDALQELGAFKGRTREEIRKLEAEIERLKRQTPVSSSPPRDELEWKRRYEEAMVQVENWKAKYVGLKAEHDDVVSELRQVQSELQLLKDTHAQSTTKIAALEDEIRRLKAQPKAKNTHSVEIMPLNTPVFLIGKDGKVIAASAGAEMVMGSSPIGKTMATEMVDPVSSAPLKAALQKAWSGSQDNAPIKVMFLTERGTRLTFLMNVFSGMDGNAELFAAPDDPFACLWEKEEVSKRWTPLGKHQSLELEEAIALGDDCISVNKGTKEELSCFISARVTTLLRTGQNQRIRRQRPRLVYDSIAPTADAKYGIASKTGLAGGTPRSSGSRK